MVQHGKTEWSDGISFQPPIHEAMLEFDRDRPLSRFADSGHQPYTDVTQTPQCYMQHSSGRGVEPIRIGRSLHDFEAVADATAPAAAS